MIPEDYAALYLQWATAIHRVDRKLKLGGPVFEGVTEDIKVWPDAQGRNSCSQAADHTISTAIMGPNYFAMQDCAQNDSVNL
jgi:hypothetical protein